MYSKFLIPAVLLALVGIVLGKAIRKPPEIPYQPEAKIFQTHEVKTSEEKLIYKAIDRAEKEAPFSVKISGGVVPHHLLAGFIIADFFKKLSPQKPKTIILVGPNHFEKGNAKILGSLYNWKTMFGDISTEEKIINDLAEKGLVKVNEEVVKNEFSLTSILPFIKFYLPETKVALFALSSRNSEKDLAAFSEELAGFLNEQTVIVASVDFSHYLLSKEAKEKDKATEKAMRNFDFRTLLSFNNDYLDSPPSVVTLLSAMQKTGKNKMEILRHTNSGILLKDENIQTTSYFSLAFH